MPVTPEILELSPVLAGIPMVVRNCSRPSFERESVNPPRVCLMGCAAGKLVTLEIAFVIGLDLVTFPATFEIADLREETNGEETRVGVGVGAGDDLWIVDIGAGALTGELTLGTDIGAALTGVGFGTGLGATLIRTGVDFGADLAGAGEDLGADLGATLAATFLTTFFSAWVKLNAILVILFVFLPVYNLTRTI